MPLTEYAGAAPQTRLSGALAVGTTSSFSVITGGGSGYPNGATAPFVVVIDRGTALEEKIRVATRAGDVFSTLTRGYDGTSAQGHSAQAIVEHVWDAASATEASLHVNDDNRDDHSQYLNPARHAATAHTGAMIQDLAVGTADLADQAITYAKLAAGERWEPGDIKPSARATPTTGWLLCDGAVISRATYANLFAGIGILYGAGDGSTTFGLPDLRQKFPMGKAASGTGSVLGSTGGSRDAVVVSHQHTFGTGNESVGHAHGLEAHQHYANLPEVGNHVHAVGGSTGFVVAFRTDAGANGHVSGGLERITFSNIEPAGGHGHDGWTDGAGALGGWQGNNVGHSHSGTTALQGGSATDANLPPWQTVNYFIKT